MASLGYALPVLAGKTEQRKHFSQEIAGPRRSEFEASRKRFGITRHASYLQQTPQGELVIVYMEAQDIRRMLEGLGTSQEPFDVWVREQTKEIHGIDLSQSQSLPEAIIDWRAAD